MASNVWLARANTSCEWRLDRSGHVPCPNLVPSARSTPRAADIRLHKVYIQSAPQTSAAFPVDRHIAPRQSGLDVILSLEHCLHRANNIVRLGQDYILQRLSHGNGNVFGSQTPGRHNQPLGSLLIHSCKYLGAQAAIGMRLMHDEQTTRAPDRLENGIHIERFDRSQINYFRFDTLLRKSLSSFEREQQ